MLDQFSSVDGLPLQQVAPFTGVPVRFVDLSLSAAGEEEARDLARAEAERLFDLERGPLLETMLLKWGNATSYCW